MSRVAAIRAPAGRADRISIVSLGLALLALIILAFTFRGLVFLTLPLSLAACLLGAWGAASSPRGTYRALAAAALVIGLLVVLASIAALFASATVSDGYDVYERTR